MAIINFHLRSGRDNDFPKKQFIVEGVEKMFCSYLFFTHSETTIQNKSEKIEYRCLLCKTTLSCMASDSRNIKRHLENDCKHSHMLAAWFKGEIFILEINCQFIDLSLIFFIRWQLNN